MNYLLVTEKNELVIAVIEKEFSPAALLEAEKLLAQVSDPLSVRQIAFNGDKVPLAAERFLLSRKGMGIISRPEHTALEKARVYMYEIYGLLDGPGLGDDISCSKCNAVALDTGLECGECGHDMRPEIYPNWPSTESPYSQDPK